MLRNIYIYFDIYTMVIRNILLWTRNIYKGLSKGRLANTQ